METVEHIHIEDVASIRNSELRVELLDGDAPRRRLVVAYELDVDPGERLVGREFAERITVHAVDEHDAAVRPDSQPVIEWSGSVICEPGVTERQAEFIVHRTALDVNQDWWSSGPGGEVQPIAEWSDHLVADVSLSVSGRIVTQTTTPTITGSWGALGEAME